jgi:hypothetical protein
MALTHSPKVATDGLVLYYDMANIQKSFTGPPTTNLNSSLTYTQSWNNSGLATWSADDQSIPRLFSDHPVSSMTKDTEGNSHIGLGNAVLSTSTTYAVSIYCYIPSNNGLALTGSVPYMRTFPSNISKGNLTYNGNSDWNQWPRNTWIRSTGTFFNGTDTSMYISCYLNTATNKIGFTAPQFEAQSFTTTYVNGARSSTQSLKDLTGRNTITSNSLTYDSDSIFRFNGSSNYLTVASAGTYSSYSIELWVKMNSLSGQQRLFSTPGGGTFTVRWNGSDFDFHYNPSDGSPPSTVTSPTGLTFSTSTYYNLVATNGPFNGALFYVNGLLRGTGERAIDLSSSPWYFGVDRTLTLWSNCMLPSAKVYSKELSATEVQQNFNALRGRYGI